MRTTYLFTTAHESEDFRDYLHPDRRFNLIGFRVVVSSPIRDADR